MGEVAAIKTCKSNHATGPLVSADLLAHNNYVVTNDWQLMIDRILYTELT